MKKKSLHAIAKKHGYKSDEDFYKDFPTEDAYIKKYGLGGPTIVPGTKYIGRGEYPGSVNPDGTVSNEVSTSMEIDGKHYLLPTFWDGKAHTNAKEIRDRYNKTKEHLGVFDTPEDAERGAHYREFMNNQLSMEDGGRLRGNARPIPLQVNREATQPDVWKYGVVPAIDHAMNKKLNGYSFSTGVDTDPSVKVNVRGMGLDYKTPIKEGSPLSIKANLGVNQAKVFVPGVDKAVYSKFQVVPQVGLSYKFKKGGKLPKYAKGGDPPTEDGKKGALTQSEKMKAYYDEQAAQFKQLGLPIPTAADSLAVYQNSLALEKFYGDPKRKYTASDPMSTYGFFDNSVDSEWNKMAYEHFKKDANETIDGAKATLKDNISMAGYYGLKSEDYIKAIDKTKKFSDYQFQVQDNVTPMINPVAPVNYQDFRIKPDYRTMYASATDSGGQTMINNYNPKNVKPSYLRTEKEKEYDRERKAMLYDESRSGLTGSYSSSSGSAPKIYKKPEPKTFGDKDRLTTLPMSKVGLKGTDPGITKPIKKGTSYPRFALPNAMALDNMRDIYEYDPKLGVYDMKTSMPFEDTRNMDIIHKNTTEAMRKDIERFLPGSTKQKAKMGKGGLVPGYGVGGAIGTTVGTALNFIPGVGPMVSAITTPLLSALGDRVEDAYSPDKAENKKTNEMNFTANPYGFKKGGRIMADGGPVDPKAVYDYLISKGVSDVHAKGMLANIKGESNFNPAALGDKGTSGGLFQHHNSRFEALKAHAGEGWADNWQKQVDYALTEGDTKKYLGQTFKDAAEATTWFTTNWERPSNATERSAERVANLAHYNFGESGTTTTTPQASPFNFSAVGEKADTLPNLTAKKYLKPFEKGGDIPGKLIPLKQEGKFDKLGNGMFFAKGPSHKEGGIEADVAGPEGMDGIANIELEGKEILMDDSGYIVRKEIASKYISALRKMESKKDSTTNRTRDFMKNKMIAENEKMLQKENPNKDVLPKAAGGGPYTIPESFLDEKRIASGPSRTVEYTDPYSLGIDFINNPNNDGAGFNAEAVGKYSHNFTFGGIDQKSVPYPFQLNNQEGVPPQPGFWNNYPVDPFAKEMTTPGGYNRPFTPNFGIGAGMNLNTDNPSFGTQGTQGLGMFGQAKGLNQGLNMLGTTGATNNPGTGGTPNQGGGNKLGSTVGDYAQLAGIAVPAIYNLIKGSQDPEVVKPIYNPREGQVDSLMANRRYNEQSTQNQITRAMNSGIGNINNSTNSASIRRSNVANLITNAEQQRASANLQGQQINNQYASEYANMANNLGGQRVAAETQAQQMNYLNRGAKDAFTSTGVTQIGQGLTEFGKMTNNAGYNNIALNTLNNAFPNYYFNTSIIKRMANGIKPSWMTEEEFQKAQTILYRQYS